MKKLLAILIDRWTPARILRGSAVLLLGAGLCLGFWSIEANAQSQAITRSNTMANPSPTPKSHKPSPTPKPKPSPSPKPGKCTVCDHDKGKDREKQIDCDKVDEYLAEHPHATRGPCQPTPVTNP
jgi:hypothetical protein